MISDSKNFFVYLLPICMSPLENVYLGTLAILKLGYLDFFAIESYEFLYILDNNTLLDTWFAKIFSHSNRLTFPFADDFLWLVKINLKWLILQIKAF